MGLSDEAQQSDQIEELKQSNIRLSRQLVRAKNKKADAVEAVYRAVKDAMLPFEFSKIVPPKPSKKKGGEIAIAILSDWQLGKTTPSYSSEICEQRVREYTEKQATIVGIQRSDHPVDRLAVFLVGDMIEGELIFPGQSYLIDSSLYQQMVVDGPRILGDYLRTSATQFTQVDVYAVPGNHGRLGGRSSKDMNPESNGDRMLYGITSQLTADVPNINWHITKGWHQVANLGERCKFMLLHGDQVRGYNGIPWYGWARKVLAWSTMARLWPDMEFDYVAAGHFHTPTNIYMNGVRVWINASTESHNEYALEQLAAAGEPAQWLLFAKEGKGVTAEYLVGLT
jgi:hypothetical protein